MTFEQVIEPHEYKLNLKELIFHFTTTVYGELLPLSIRNAIQYRLLASSTETLRHVVKRNGKWKISDCRVSNKNDWKEIHIELYYKILHILLFFVMSLLLSILGYYFGIFSLLLSYIFSLGQTTPIYTTSVFETPVFETSTPNITYIDMASYPSESPVTPVEIIQDTPINPSVVSEELPSFVPNVDVETIEAPEPVESVVPVDVPVIVEAPSVNTQQKVSEYVGKFYASCRKIHSNLRKLLKDAQLFSQSQYNNFINLIDHNAFFTRKNAQRVILQIKSTVNRAVSRLAGIEYKNNYLTYKNQINDIVNDISYELAIIDVSIASSPLLKQVRTIVNRAINSAYEMVESLELGSYWAAFNPFASKHEDGIIEEVEVMETETSKEDATEFPEDVMIVFEPEEIEEVTEEVTVDEEEIEDLDDIVLSTPSEPMVEPTLPTLPPIVPHVVDNTNVTTRYPVSTILVKTNEIAKLIRLCMEVFLYMTIAVTVVVVIHGIYRIYSFFTTYKRIGLCLKQGFKLIILLLVYLGVAHPCIFTTTICEEADMTTKYQVISLILYALSSAFVWLQTIYLFIKYTFA